jgi:hypothetical protein
MTATVDGYKVYGHPSTRKISPIMGPSIIKRLYFCEICKTPNQCKEELYYHPTKHRLVCRDRMCQGEVRDQRGEDLL